MLTLFPFYIIHHISYSERETPPIGFANGSFPPRARGFPFLNSLWHSMRSGAAKRGLALLRKVPIKNQRFFSLLTSHSSLLTPHFSLLTPLTFSAKNLSSLRSHTKKKDIIHLENSIQGIRPPTVEKRIRSSRLLCDILM